MFSNNLISTIYQVAADHRRELAQHAAQERIARACSDGNGPRQPTRLLRIVMALNPARARRRKLRSALA
jgi:hypothetical protein